MKILVTQLQIPNGSGEELARLHCADIPSRISHLQVLANGCCKSPRPNLATKGFILPSPHRALPSVSIVLPRIGFIYLTHGTFTYALNFFDTKTDRSFHHRDLLVKTEYEKPQTGPEKQSATCSISPVRLGLSAPSAWLLASQSDTLSARYSAYAVSVRQLINTKSVLSSNLLSELCRLTRHCSTFP